MKSLKIKYCGKPCTKRKHQDWYLLEGFVHRPVPADESRWAEQNEPQDSQAEIHPTPGVNGEMGQARQHVQEEGDTVDCTKKAHLHYL